MSIGSLPGISLTLIVTAAEPGITLLRNPAFMMTGAIVSRIMACSRGSLLISRSARRTSAGSLPVRLRKCVAIGSLLVFARVWKNRRVLGISFKAVS